MSIKLTYSAIQLLKHILTTNGDKEINQKGEEVASPRRLNGEESSQRRFYMKAIEDIVKKGDEEINALLQSHNALVEEEKKEFKEKNPKKKAETDKEYENREVISLNKNKKLLDSLEKLNETIKTLNDTAHEITLTENTTKVVKKYFTEFGTKIGFSVGDDETVSAIEESLK